MGNFLDPFSEILEDVNIRMLDIGFSPFSVYNRGKIYVAEYKSMNCVVKFLYGPPEFRIVTVVSSSSREYEFKDLLQISEISTWVSKNGCGQKGLKAELLWYIKLLKFSLRFLGCSTRK